MHLTSSEKKTFLDFYSAQEYYVRYKVDKYVRRALFILGVCISTIIVLDTYVPQLDLRWLQVLLTVLAGLPLVYCYFYGQQWHARLPTDAEILAAGTEIKATHLTLGEEAALLQLLAALKAGVAEDIAAALPDSTREPALHKLLFVKHVRDGLRHGVYTP